MTDPLTPQERRVRDLLADARHEGPPPPDVVARLDETLARLRGEAASDPAIPPASPPARRPATDLGRARHERERRRRTLATVLVAATLVVVGGVGVQRLAGGEGSDSADAGASAGSDAGASSVPPEALRDEDADGGAASPGDPPSLDAESAPDAPLAAEPTLAADTLRSDVLAIRDQVAAGRLTALLDPGRLCPAGDPAALRAALEDAKVRVLQVAYEGEAAVLLLPAVTAEGQAARLITCDGTTDRTVALPAP